jgi:hypothetical protein
MPAARVIVADMMFGSCIFNQETLFKHERQSTNIGGKTRILYHTLASNSHTAESSTYVFSAFQGGTGSDLLLLLLPTRERENLEFKYEK